MFPFPPFPSTVSYLIATIQIVRFISNLPNLLRRSFLPYCRENRDFRSLLSQIFNMFRNHVLLIAREINNFEKLQRLGKLRAIPRGWKYYSIGSIPRILEASREEEMLSWNISKHVNYQQRLSGAARDALEKHFLRGRCSRGFSFNSQ